MGKKCQKAVSFAECIETVREIEQLTDFTAEERTSLWFSREEFDEIKAAYRNIIEMMRKKQLLTDTEEHCTRGLECRSIAGSKRRRDTQLKGLLAVLGEQDRQKADGVQEPETMAIVYRQYAYHAQQAATNMGRRDYESVAEFMYDLPAEYRIGLPVVASRTIVQAAQPRRSVGLGASPRSRVTVSLGGISRRRATAA